MCEETLAKNIVIETVKNRGLRLKYIAESADVSYTNLCKWINDKKAFSSENIIKVSNFIKKYYNVTKLEELQNE